LPDRFLRSDHLDDAARPHAPVEDWGGSSLIMSLEEDCAGQAGAEPPTWETSRGRG
jgi:hypothetical protein